MVFTELALWADSVIKLPCPSVCVFFYLSHCETPTSGGCGTLWSKSVLLILVCDDTIFKKKMRVFFSEIVKADHFGPHPKTPTFRCCGELWSKNVFLILACDQIIKKSKKSEIVKMHGFEPTPKRKKVDPNFFF